MVNQEIGRIIGEAIGAASMCWIPRPSDQVFDSEQASKIVDDLIYKLDKLGFPNGKLLVYGDALVVDVGDECTCGCLSLFAHEQYCGIEFICNMKDIDGLDEYIKAQSSESKGIIYE